MGVLLAEPERSDDQWSGLGGVMGGYEGRVVHTYMQMLIFAFYICS